MTTFLRSVAVAVNYHVLNKECAYFIWGHFDLLLINQLVDTARSVGGNKRGTTYSGTKGYWIMFILTKTRKYFLLHCILQVTYHKFSWPSFTKSSVYKSLFLSELCWKPIIVFDTCQILGAGCILSGFGSYYYTGIPF
jgi:hypothetical protein